MTSYYKRYISAIAMVLAIAFDSCTDLDETTYDEIVSDTFYQTKDDVIRSFLRTYEHGYWSINSSIYFMQELSADQLMTPTRENHWYDGGTYVRLHNHTWTAQESYLSSAWEALFVGIGLANNSLEDIKALDPLQFDMTEAERNQMIAELRVMRAWYYIKGLDLFRNIPLVTKFKGADEAPMQEDPDVIFNFIETELKEALEDIGAKGDDNINANRWTKAGAMALLARLYLNAEVYTGVAHYDECETVCQNIIDGNYGNYAIENRWDAPFDWDNVNSDETIFAFPGAFSRTHWHYGSGMYWWSLPFNAPKYFEFDDLGNANPRFSLQPGRNVDNELYEFSSGLGQPFVKFQKYTDDVRLSKYKNLGGNQREGMFLYGYLEYNGGERVTSDAGQVLYIRDAAGWFGELGPGEYPEDKESNMLHTDQNSGIYHVKYPFYKSTDKHKMESDYAEVRLAEIYYTMAECKFRAGQTGDAETLLDAVRQRYYPVGSESLYSGELTEQELIDEWGREFLAEGRRRTDLIRFNKFTSGNWWDKLPDSESHLTIYPISEEILGISKQLNQNPGY